MINPDDFEKLLKIHEMTKNPDGAFCWYQTDLPYLTTGALEWKSNEFTHQILSGYKQDDRGTSYGHVRIQHILSKGTEYLNTHLSTPCTQRNEYVTYTIVVPSLTNSDLRNCNSLNSIPRKRNGRKNDNATSRDLTF